jgi:flavin reductase (DIM6/NTAB) family NADH-FMN oxidoreductase RutF
LGNYPTGVTVITALAADGYPAGMTVGTFTSVSIDPPLVAFLADKASTSFPRIRTAPGFCANVLAVGQDEVGRVFAAQGVDKFRRMTWAPTDTGAPRFEGVAAWVDCVFDSIQEMGDHLFVVGRVRDMDACGDRHPLLFLRGSFGRFAPAS